MRRGPVSFEAAVRAFREATAAAPEGSATRARVLARAAGGVARPPAWRMLALGAGAAVAVLSSASLAFTASGWPASWPWRRAPAPSVIEDAPAAGPERPVVHHAWRTIPPMSGAPEVRVPGAAGTEDDVYARAHHAHFVADAPARALAAWDQYLDAYPDGTFAPEARFNRAICLARLGRYGQAARALRPFARGLPDGYRREDARVLLDWMTRTEDRR